MIKTVLSIGLFLGFFLFFSCSKESLKSPTASYLVVNTPVLSVPSSSMGTNSHKITDVWLYVNDNFQGCFPINTVMPIVASGSADIKLFAGIRNNGIGSTRQPYVMFKPITFNQLLDPGVTYSMTPVFEYISYAKFLFHEEFEGFGCQFIPETNPGDSSFVITSNPAVVFGGNGKSLFMGMSDAKPTSKIISTSNYYFPLSGSSGYRIYMEMNYKCNQEITVGLIGGGQERSAITLRASDEWNKIYVELTTAVNTQPTYNYYNLYIAATKQQDIANPQIYIDNIKVVTE